MSVTTRGARAPLKVIILAAGRGGRMSSVSPHLHKALLSVENKPIINHILEKLPVDSEIYIAVGYKADQIKDYFSVCAFEQKITFIDIPNFSGEGSGPGTTLLQCQDHLTSPFLIVCADTLWSEDLVWDRDKNTIFVNTTTEKDLSRFCNIATDARGLVSGIFDKQTPIVQGSTTIEQFTGLAYVYDTDAFFENLETATTIAGERQICSGFSSLVKDKQCFTAPLVTWKDAGTPENYRALQTSTDNSFQKIDEDIFFVGSHVIKFFNNIETCRNRVARFEIDKDVHPVLFSSGRQFYSYYRTPGDTLKSVLTPERFSAFIKYCQSHLWIKRSDTIEFKDAAHEFYEEKTAQRFEKICALYPNHKLLPSMAQFLDQFDWKRVVAGASSYRFHGDLQLDNVIVNGRNFQLIDFRQDFSGLIDCGDIQYDFAKLMTSIVVDFDALKTQKNLNAIPSIENAAMYLDHLRSVINDYKLSSAVIESLVPVVLINMMPLHTREVALLLASTIERLMIDANMGVPSDVSP